MFSRQDIESREEKILVPYACKSIDSGGRQYTEEPDLYRTDFQRDRDRIIHSKAWRRLSGKTQVFMAGEGDHYRTRLTHTNEVQQISRNIARTLGLNEDLAESIALAHDLGHTPFGHAGEKALNDMMKPFGKHFEHNEQSRRVVEVLENVYPHILGLNLTKAVRDGLTSHVSLYDQKNKKQSANTLEAQVVNIADEIAYHHHDIDDGFRSGNISLHEISSIPLVHQSFQQVIQKHGKKLETNFFQKRLLTTLIHTMIVDVMDQTTRNIQQYNVHALEDIEKIPDLLVTFSPDMKNKVKALADMLWKKLYTSPHVKEQAEEAEKIIRALFTHYNEYAEQLPEKEKERIVTGEAKEDVVKDYIAGMTDHYAIVQYKKIYPKRKIKAIQLSLLSE